MKTQFREPNCIILIPIFSNSNLINYLRENCNVYDNEYVT